MASDCLFCKIVAREIPAQIVYEDESTLAFLDINPVNPGHTLVIPKEHSTDIFDIDDKNWTAVMKTSRTVAHALERALKTDGVNIGMNNREHAGQVVDHIHIHIIPRFKDDGVELMGHHARREDEGESVARKIRAELSKG